MTRPIETILLPSDLSPAADAALAHARFLAESFDARLVLYHVAAIPPSEYGAWAAGREQEVWSRIEDTARRELSRRAEGLRVPVEVVVRHDVPSARVLVDLALLDQIQRTRPDLVVMAMRSRMGFSRFFVGSVTEQVVRHAGRPVLAVRDAGQEAMPYRVVLVATDLSTASRRAFPTAALLARRFSARVVAVHVASESGARPTPDEVRRFLRPDFEDAAARVVSGGAPWRGIVDTAGEEKADLVAVSRQGADSLGEEILGSTTDRVLRHAPCPVLVA